MSASAVTVRLSNTRFSRAGEIGGRHQEADRRGTDGVEVEEAAIRSRSGAGSKQRAGLVEDEEGEPAREEAGEDHRRAQRVDLLARDPAPHRLEPVGPSASRSWRR